MWLWAAPGSRKDALCGSKKACLDIVKNVVCWTYWNTKIYVFSGLYGLYEWVTWKLVDRFVFLWFAVFVLSFSRWLALIRNSQQREASLGVVWKVHTFRFICVYIVSLKLKTITYFSLLIFAITLTVNLTVGLHHGDATSRHSYSWLKVMAWLLAGTPQSTSLAPT